MKIDREVRRKKVRRSLSVSDGMAEALRVMKAGGKIILEYGVYWLCGAPMIPHNGSTNAKTVAALVSRKLIHNAYGYRTPGGWSQVFTLTQDGRDYKCLG